MDSLISTLLSFSASTALAENFLLRTGIPGPLPPESGILGTIQNAYLLALGFAGVLALGSIVYGAVLYTLSRGNPTALSDAWDRIIQALIGVLLLVGAGTILSIVNPGLLSLELPQLQKPTPRVYQGGTVPVVGTVTPPGNTSQIPTKVVPLPTEETPQTGELRSCQTTTLKQSPYRCAGRWVDDPQSCSGNTPHLCIYPGNGPLADACQLACPSGSAWKGILVGAGSEETCVCDQPPIVVDTEVNNTWSCHPSNLPFSVVKCISGAWDSNLCASQPQPYGCRYPSAHACKASCAADNKVWWGLVFRDDGACACTDPE